VSILKKPGLRDWWLQRITTLFILIFGCIFTGYWWSHSGSGFSEWRMFMLQPWMRILTLLMVISIAIHSSIGWWIVLTDYVKCRWIRGCLLGTVYSLMLVACLLMIYWMWSWV
jgi:succinate dehydrogenase / fumarate reductase, membrane anchor subunit